MTKEELKKEAEKKYCNGCKWRIEQCLWAWRNTNGLNEPNEKNCSCKEVPAYLAGAEPREKRIAELEKENAELKEKYVKNITDCDICDTYCNSQLTKAKKIIKDLLGSENTCCEEEMFFEIRQKAENFLKDSEVEK